MQKNKIDFIADLLADKRIDVPLKEKTFELASGEVKGFLKVESENLERILEIENRLKLFENSFEGTTSTVRSNKYSKSENTNDSPHKPKDVAEFLFHFRDRKNQGLKYLTHKWDATQDPPLNYELVIKNAITEFWECRKNYRIPIELYSRILQYVIAKTETKVGSDGKRYEYPHFFYFNEKNERINIYLGWSSNQMKEWVEKNPNQDPNLDDNWTQKLINPFKHSIEVRAKTLKKYLQDSINFIYKNKIDTLNLELDDSLNDARFFTDVPKLFEGIREILTAARAFAEESNINPYVKITYDTPESSDNYAIRRLTITTSKELTVNNTFDPEKGGNFGSAYNHFLGLCNWSIICKQNQKVIKFNVLSDEKEYSKKEILENYIPEGFTHILTFFAL